MDLTVQKQYEEIKPTANNLVEQSKRLIVNSEETYKVGCDLGQRVQKGIKFVSDMFKEPKKKAKDAHKAICDLESNLLDPLKEAKDLLARNTGRYKAEQDRLARIESERLLAEQKKLDEEKALESAINAEASGNREIVDTILDEAVEANSMLINPVVEGVAKQKGTATRTYWKFKTIDVNKIDRKYMIPNEKMIQEIVNAMQDKTDIEGIEVYCETKTNFIA